MPNILAALQREPGPAAAATTELALAQVGDTRGVPALEKMCEGIGTRVNLAAAQTLLVDFHSEVCLASLLSLAQSGESTERSNTVHTSQISTRVASRT